MAIALDSSSGGQDSGGTTLTVAHTCSGSNRILLVWVSDLDGAGVSGVTYNGVAMTEITHFTNSAGRVLYAFYLIAPDTGANNIIVTFTVTHRIRMVAMSYTGAKQSSQPDASNTNSGTSTGSNTVSVTVVASNCWLTEGFAIQDYTTGDSLVNATLRNNGPTGALSDGGMYVLGADSNATVGTGAQSIGDSTGINTNNWSVIGVSIAPAVASTTPPSRLAAMGVG